MEQKKNPKADLEKRKGLFLEIGLVVILAVCLCAFSIRSYDKDDSSEGNQGPAEEVEQMDEILNTDVEDTPPPPPPPPAERKKRKRKNSRFSPSSRKIPNSPVVLTHSTSTSPRTSSILSWLATTASPARCTSPSWWSATVASPTPRSSVTSVVVVAPKLSASSRPCLSGLPASSAAKLSVCSSTCLSTSTSSKGEP